MEFNDENAGRFLYPVAEKPVPHPNLDTNTSYKYIYNADTERVISIMTEDYRLVTNNELLNKIDPVLTDCGGRLVRADEFGEARFKFTFEFPQNPFTINKDRFSPRVVATNSYDGSISIKFLTGAVRLICTNGMVGITYSEISGDKHHVNNENLEHIEDLFFGAYNSIEQSFIKLNQLLKPVEPKHIAEVINMFPSTVHQHILKYAKRNVMKTFYDLYNMATYTLTHEMNRTYETTHQLEGNIYKDILSLAKV